MELVFAYLAGLLTLINPCVLPVLPIVLASSMNADRRAPVVLAAGMSVSFVALGVGIAAAGPALGITQDRAAEAAALAMIAFGAILLVPAFGRSFSLAISGLAVRADARIGHPHEQGLGGQFMAGSLLGAVWSPCIGPTLGAAIALASTGQNLGAGAATMTAFAMGVSTLIVVASYGARDWTRRNGARLATFSRNARPLLGIAFVAVGAALFFRLHHLVEAWLLGVLPAWLVDLSVSI